jgi:hypothetical protein
MKLWTILVLLLITSNAEAAVGKITEQVAAPATIQRQKNTLEGAKGAGVEMDDAIRTRRGKVGITFQDDTRVQVNENSKLVIDDFVYDPKAKTGKIAMKMALGTVRYASGAIAHNNPNKVSINTPSATISVRGTDFTATVDELGQSTIILLPSCPNDQKKPSRTKDDIEANCVTGSIVVESDVGQVILNQPFQATRVESRGSMPAKPVILNLSEDTIGNMLMLSPPKELKKEEKGGKHDLKKSVLDVDFLAEQGLVNALDSEEQELNQDKLSRNFLDQDFLANILDIVNAQLAAQLDFLNNTKSGLLPDYYALSGIVVEIDEPKLTLCRDSGSDIQCVTTPTSQNSTIYQTQDNIEFKNRVNSGAGTTITLIQK